MTIIISALHFAWRGIDACFARAKNDLRLDGVEFPVREDRRLFDACVGDLRRRWKPAPPDGKPGGAATGRG
jgi:hypothetical protein